MAIDIDIALIPYGDMNTILPLVYELNNKKIDMNTLANRLEAILKMGGYQCIGAYDGKDLIGICGFWVLNKFYVGKHLEPDNVFIDERYRSRGVGQLMMDFLFQYAREIGCEGSEVNCYLVNEKGQRFWERQGYQPLAYHYFMNFEEVGDE